MQNGPVGKVMRCGVLLLALTWLAQAQFTVYLRTTPDPGVTVSNVVVPAGGGAAEVTCATPCNVQAGERIFFEDAMFPTDDLTGVKQVGTVMSSTKFTLLEKTGAPYINDRYGVCADITFPRLGQTYRFRFGACGNVLGNRPRYKVSTSDCKNITTGGSCEFGALQRGELVTFANMPGNRYYLSRPMYLVKRDNDQAIEFHTDASIAASTGTTDGVPSDGGHGNWEGFNGGAGNSRARFRKLTAVTFPAEFKFQTPAQQQSLVSWIGTPQYNRLKTAADGYVNALNAAPVGSFAERFAGGFDGGALAMGTMYLLAAQPGSPIADQQSFYGNAYKRQMLMVWKWYWGANGLGVPYGDHRSVAGTTSEPNGNQNITLAAPYLGLAYMAGRGALSGEAGTAPGGVLSEREYVARQLAATYDDGVGCTNPLITIPNKYVVTVGYRLLAEAGANLQSAGINPYNVIIVNDGGGITESPSRGLTRRRFIKSIQDDTHGTLCHYSNSSSVLSTACSNADETPRGEVLKGNRDPLASEGQDGDAWVNESTKRAWAKVGGTWVRQVSAGGHTLEVQFMPQHWISRDWVPGDCGVMNLVRTNYSAHTDKYGAHSVWAADAPFDGNLGHQSTNGDLAINFAAAWDYAPARYRLSAIWQRKFDYEFPYRNMYDSGYPRQTASGYYYNTFADLILGAQFLNAATEGALAPLDGQTWVKRDLMYPIYNHYPKRVQDANPVIQMCFRSGSDNPSCQPFNQNAHSNTIGTVAAIGHNLPEYPIYENYVNTVFANNRINGQVNDETRRILFMPRTGTTPDYDALPHQFLFRATAKSPAGNGLFGGFISHTSAPAGANQDPLGTAVAMSATFFGWDHHRESRPGHYEIASGRAMLSAASDHVAGNQCDTQPDLGCYIKEWNVEGNQLNVFDEKGERNYADYRAINFGNQPVGEVPTTNISPIYIRRWAGQDPGGVASNKHAYALVDLNAYYGKNLKLTTAQRQFVHLKAANGTGKTNYFLVYSTVRRASASAMGGIQNESFVHINSGDDQEGALDISGLAQNRVTSYAWADSRRLNTGLVDVNGQTHKMVLLRNVSVSGGGNGKGQVQQVVLGPSAVVGTYKLVADSATAFRLLNPAGEEVATATAGTYFRSLHMNFNLTVGGTAFAAGDEINIAVTNRNTGATFYQIAVDETGVVSQAGDDFVTVHQVGGSGVTMPELSNIAVNGGSHRGVQIADPEQPYVVLMPQTQANASDVSFTTTHGGDAYLVAAGLSPGNYEVRRDGAAVCTNVVVVSGDNSLACEGVGAGSIQVVRTNVAPVSITTTSLPDGQRAVPYSRTVACAGGAAPYLFSVTAGTLPEGLTLEASSGLIAGTPVRVQAATFTVACSDTEGTVDQKGLSITIPSQASSPLTITTASLPGASTGVSYSQPIAHTGGVAPVTFSTTSGVARRVASVPAGVTTPDGYAWTSRAGYGSSNLVYTNNGSRAIANTVRDQLFQWEAVGVKAPLTWTATGLANGAYVLRLGFTEFYSQHAPNRLMEVSYNGGSGTKQLLAPFTPAQASGGLNIAYEPTFAVTVTGGTLTVTFSPSQGCGECNAISNYVELIKTDLPPGMNLSGSGTVSGTATAPGTFTFRVTATDAEGTSVSKDITLGVSSGQGSPPSIGTRKLADAVVGTPYGVQLVASGGSGVLNWSGTTGLPAGLTVTAGGLISGSASGAPGSSSVQLHVVDEVGAAASTALDLSVFGNGVKSRVLEAGSTDVVWTFGGAGLAQSTACTAEVASDEAFENVVQASDAGGGALRRVVFSGLTPGTGYWMRGTCGLQRAQASTMTGTAAAVAASVNVRTRSVLTADELVVEYGATESLGSTVTGSCTNGVCSALLPGVKGKALYYRTRLNQGAVAMAVSGKTVVIPQ